MAGCKALGLINKVLTGPLWCVILDMNGVYTSMRDQFKVRSEGAVSSLKDKSLSLMTPPSNMKYLTTSVLKSPIMQLFSSCFKLSSKLSMFYVSVFWWITLEEFMTIQVKRCQTQSVPKTNSQRVRLCST